MKGYPTISNPTHREEALDSPKSMTQDEIELLAMYRKAKRARYSDLFVSIQEGVRVKLWITEKMR